MNQYYPSGRARTATATLLDPFDLGPVVQQLVTGARAALDQRMAEGVRTGDELLRRLRATGACAPPPMSCPDPCVGTVVRQAYLGERVRIAIKVRNRSAKARTYRFEAEPLRSARGDTPGPLDIQPAELTLAPMQLGMLAATVDVGRGFEPATEYRSHVFVRSEGCETQYVCVVVSVLSDDVAAPFDLTCPCRPKSRRVEWYHHFYCDPVEPDRPTPQPPRDVAPDTPGASPVDAAIPARPVEG